MVPYRDAATRLYSAPLLPYERDLIATIGCSEDEYRWYRAQIATLSKERPSEYALVPDVRNDAVVVPLLVSLAVGVLTTAVSYFLTPRPETPSQGRTRRLASANGRSRFNQTFGFEGSAEIAQFGATVPIVFGRYTERVSHTTGGILVSPALVWSRMFSYGSSQGYKGLYVVGESILTTPTVNGVFLGTAPLSALPAEQYALYWSSKEGDNRVKAGDLFAGTRANKYSGDQETNDDIFQCPTLSAEVDTGFSSVYTPTGSVTFGAFSPIKNGTHYKVNWQIVSIPKEEDPDSRLKDTRKKIAGKAADGREDGMPGVGAGYSCFMGLIRHNNNEYEYPTRVTIAVGDTVEFQINDREFDDDIFETSSGVTLDDLNTRSIQEREEADNLLQIGEMFMIGRSVWQVINRPDAVWRVNKGNFSYTLKCLETTGGARQVGIAGTKAVQTQIGHDGITRSPQYVGPSFFPLLHVAFATVRNQRVVDVTEFGIRSQVWNRASGLCNFPEVPTPARLSRFDSKGTTLTTGTRSGYFKRTSFFTIAVRPVGLTASGQPYDWELLGENFCVTGKMPTNAYNYIRIRSQVPGQFEYRFIPRSGADIRELGSESDQFWRLNSTGGVINSTDRSNKYGVFRIVVTGEPVTTADVLTNTEMRTKGKKSIPGSWTTQAARLVVNEWLPSNVTGGKFGGWHTHYLGPPSDYQGQERSVPVILTWAPGKTVTIRLTAKSISTPNNPYSSWAWQNPSTMTITGWSSEPPNNYSFEALTAVNNVFMNATVGPKLTVVHDSVYVPGDADQAERWFELASQIADVSHFEEIEKSNNSDPEHEIIYVNESVANTDLPTYYNMTMLGLAIRSSRSVTNLDQIRAWVPNGVSTRRFNENTTGPSNNFADLVYFLLSDKRSGAGRRVSADLINTDGFEQTAKFLEQNNIYFDGVIEEQINVREYISQMAPLHLCNFVIANGKFSIAPALPTNTDGTLNKVAVPISALFTAGNIIEETFSVNYIDASEREKFRAVVTYREGAKNQLPEQRSMMVYWSDNIEEFNQAKMETFDMSSFCTYREHAFLVARYLLSVRRRVTHTISFKTTPEGLYLAPGQYIRVITKASPNVSYNNGVIDGSGNVTSLGATLNGTYDVFAYRTGDIDVRQTTLTVSNGSTSNTSLFNSLFTVRNSATNCNIYQVDQITMDEDGLVEIQASHFPCDSSLRSLIVQDVIDPARYKVLD